MKKIDIVWFVLTSTLVVIVGIPVLMFGLGKLFGLAGLIVGGILTAAMELMSVYIVSEES